jgi:hypothetical protein
MSKQEEKDLLVLKIAEVEGNVKVIRICHRDEIVYIATNATDIDDTELIKTYKKRWKVETFHRDSKQHLGLENIRMRNWQKPQNHVGFACLLMQYCRYLELIRKAQLAK